MKSLESLQPSHHRDALSGHFLNDVTAVSIHRDTDHHSRAVSFGQVRLRQPVNVETAQ